MNNLDIIKICLENLYKRKLRTALTMLSVVIGTFSIVLIIALGIGLKQNVSDNISKLGSLHVIKVYPKYTETGMKALSTTDIKKISKMAHVEWIVPLRKLSGLQIKTDKYQTYIDLVGVDEKHFDKFNFKMAEGELLKKGDRSSIMFGSQILTQFQEIKKSNSVNQLVPKPVNINITKERFHLMQMNYSGGEDNVTNPKTPNPYPIKVVGVTKPEGDDLFFGSLISMSEFNKIKAHMKISSSSGGSANKISDKYAYDELRVSVIDTKQVKKIQEQLTKLGYANESLLEQIEYTNQLIAVIQTVLSSIAAISLLIAGIGITNTMMMSVFERKKEIGIMKVIGASMPDIRKLFLVESSMIGLFGGAIGIFCCYMLALVLNHFSVEISSLMQMNTGSNPAEGGETSKFKLIVIPVWLVLSSVSFTAIIGLLSGYLPARRAMRLSALEAINS